MQPGGPIWHNQTPDETVRDLATDPRTVLAPNEAEERLIKHGLNELVEQPRPGFWQMLLDQFNNFVVIILIIGVTSWPYLARIVRAEFLSLKENEFILAARAIGTPTSEIIVRHILPNSVAPIVVAATLAVASAITTEAYISFLGLGVQPPDPSWGGMLSNGRPFMEIAPWVAIFPGMAIALAVLGFNLLGDGLRDVLDPRLKEGRG